MQRSSQVIHAIIEDVYLGNDLCIQKLNQLNIIATYQKAQIRHEIIHLTTNNETLASIDSDQYDHLLATIDSPGSDPYYDFLCAKFKFDHHDQLIQRAFAFARFSPAFLAFSTTHASNITIQTSLPRTPIHCFGFGLGLLIFCRHQKDQLWPPIHYGFMPLYRYFLSASPLNIEHMRAFMQQSTHKDSLDKWMKHLNQTSNRETKQINQLIASVLKIPPENKSSCDFNLFNPTSIPPQKSFRSIEATNPAPLANNHPQISWFWHLSHSSLQFILATGCYYTFINLTSFLLLSTLTWLSTLMCFKHDHFPHHQYPVKNTLIFHGLIMLLIGVVWWMPNAQISAIFTSALLPLLTLTINAILSHQPNHLAKPTGSSPLP